MTFTKLTQRVCATLALGAVLALSSQPAFAGVADDIFGGSSPIQKLQKFMTGPLAFTIVIIGIVVMGGMLMFGNDLSGFGRRVMLLVLGGGLVLGAVSVVGTLFDTTETSGALYGVGEVPVFGALAEFTTTPAPR